MFSPNLESSFNNTRLRDPRHVCSLSGMCAMCTSDCIGSCEVGLSAVRGKDAVYPTTTGSNQVASEKKYPVDFSHFNINGRVFGAVGAEPGKTAIHDVDVSRTMGRINPVKLMLPLILPAIAKLDWQDYFAGAAMAGVSAVIGEDAVKKDEGLQLESGKVISSPFLRECFAAFRKYYRGYGQIILQVNADDEKLGVPEYAIQNCGADAVEFKFGQSAKGVQPVKRIASLEKALAAQALGTPVYPDPSDPGVQREYKAGRGENFRSYGTLPMWDEKHFAKRIDALRRLGVKNVYFKMAGYDPADLERVLRIASDSQADLVTFDGAGGGTGYSPCKMMNEWGLPVIMMERKLVSICRRLESEGLLLPEIAVTGGFAMEDGVFKALALGAPYVHLVGLCRASMAAAMSGKKIGELLENGQLPPELKKFGSAKDELFPELRELRNIYGAAADNFSTGAIGVYSYLSRVGFGLQHFAALNRKFSLKYIDRSDVIPLTKEARDLIAE